MEDILNVTSKVDSKTKANKHKYQEPLLYANEYFFKDEENLKKFLEIQKRSKMIRRKLMEMKQLNLIKKNKVNKNKVQEAKSFFYK